MKTDDKDIKLDSFHYHEALDRLWVVNTMIDELINSHPVIWQDEEVANMIAIAQTSLADAYQKIGSTKTPGEVLMEWKKTGNVVIPHIETHNNP